MKITVDNLLTIFDLFRASDPSELRRLELYSDLVAECLGGRSFENSQGKPYHDYSVKLRIESPQAVTRAAEWLFTSLSNKGARITIETEEIKLDKAEIERVVARKYAIETASLLKDSFSETHHKITRKTSVYGRSLAKGWLCYPAFIVLAVLSLTPSFNEWLQSLISVPTAYTVPILGLSAFGTLFLMVRQFAALQRLDLTPEEQMFTELYRLLPDLSEYAKTRDDEARIHICDSLRKIVRPVGQTQETWTTGPLKLAKAELAKPLESFWKNLSERLLPFFEEGNEYYLAVAVQTLKFLLSFLDRPSLNTLNTFNEESSRLPTKPFVYRPSLLIRLMAYFGLMDCIAITAITSLVLLVSYWGFSWGVQKNYLYTGGIALFGILLVAYYNWLRRRRLTYETSEKGEDSGQSKMDNTNSS